MKERIRAVLHNNARLPVDVDTLSDDSNLYIAGMTSHANVNVILALEIEFGVEFPNNLLRRAVFSSITTIYEALQELGKESSFEKI